ncbi:MAG: tripartite tricarboxylate transporter substrate binding protein [Nitrospinaceae bacterium]|nr:tripartite tricarboxylate transporter substrate binding protein [Nitrospinaceae bacterium]MBT3434334.1 tripartite tricarboxylate transporter substrate binding protein [Nitrospinaceae bacterium]MBT3820078.1 tripartite tricarboxylate transporter substrate binding protein [Nitrospinaceae bacterium]MBT4094969.1 tripartite tricarboxylate transporter substrate binding protein [Nitrospinaceae bacterium]MBT4432240.1 tripartite tricarboxylate transporter substrate binding protein [Nitrospinaceae bact
MKKRLISLFSALAFLAAIASASALSAEAASPSDLPCRAVKLIVPWGAGGGTDVIFRIVARAAQKHLGKDIIVQNIGGQGGNKGAKVAKASKPNGCTLFAGHDSMHTSYVQGRVNFSFFAFEPLVLVTHTPSIIGAHPGVPWKTAKALVADMKKNSGKKVLFGATLGSTSHFFPVLIEAGTGVKFKYVGYDGTRQRMTALLGKHIQLGELNISSAKKYLGSGKLIGLGIALEKRDSRLPNLPTLKEQGINVVTGVNRGVFAPKGTPDNIQAIFEKAFGKAMKDPEVVKNLTAKGVIIQFKGRKGYSAFLKGSAAKITGAAKRVGLYKRSN